MNFVMGLLPSYDGVQWSDTDRDQMSFTLNEQNVGDPENGSSLIFVSAVKRYAGTDSDDTRVDRREPTNAGLSDVKRTSGCTYLDVLRSSRDVLDDQLDFSVVCAVLVLRVASVQCGVGPIGFPDTQFGGHAVGRDGLDDFIPGENDEFHVTKVGYFVRLTRP